MFYANVTGGADDDGVFYRVIKLIRLQFNYDIIIKPLRSQSRAV